MNFEQTIADLQTALASALRERESAAPPVYTSPGASPRPPFRRPKNVMDDPGYCYLALFKSRCWDEISEKLGAYPLRGAVERELHSGAPRHDGFLRLTFGTPASARLSQKFQAHVARADHSLLKVNDILALMPFASRYGDATHLKESFDASLQTAPATATTPLPGLPSLLGTMPSPTLRRFCFEYADVHTSATPNGFVRNHFQPHNAGSITAYTKYSSYAAYTMLSVRFVPLYASSCYNVLMSTAWYANNETAPSSAAQFSDCPTHAVHSIAPAHGEGASTGLTVACPVADGISLQFRPAPWLGGSPGFAYRHLAQVSSGEYAADVPLFRMYIECIITLVPLSN